MIKVTFFFFVFFLKLYLLFLKEKVREKCFFFGKKLDKEQNGHLGISITYVTYEAP